MVSITTLNKNQTKISSGLALYKKKAFIINNFNCKRSNNNLNSKHGSYERYLAKKVGNIFKKEIKCQNKLI